MPVPEPIISPSISDHHFDIATLFNKLKDFETVSCRMTPTHTAPRTRVVSYVLEAYKFFFYRNRHRRNFEKGSFD